MSMVNPTPQPESSFSSIESTNSVVWLFESTCNTTPAPPPEIVEELRRCRLARETQSRRAMEQHQEEVERLKKKLEDHKNKTSGNEGQ